MTHLKKLESMSLKMAEAVIDVRSWSGTLSKALNKKRGYNLANLHDEAQKIEDFAGDLKRALAIRYLWANDHDVTSDTSNKVLSTAYHQMRSQEIDENIRRTDAVDAMVAGQVTYPCHPESYETTGGKVPYHLTSKYITGGVI